MVHINSWSTTSQEGGQERGSEETTSEYQEDQSDGSEKDAWETLLKPNEVGLISEEGID